MTKVQKSDRKPDRAESELRARLGSALRSARQKKGLTQGDVAERVQTDPETISRFERGATLPSLVRLLSLADALGATVASLLGAASPRLDDEWEELRASLSRLPMRDRKLAMAILRAVVSERAG